MKVGGEWKMPYVLALWGEHFNDEGLWGCFVELVERPSALALGQDMSSHWPSDETLGIDNLGGLLS